MTSKEALERITQSHYIAMSCLGIEKPDIETEKAIDIIAKDLKVLEIIKKHTHSMEVTMPDNEIKVLGWAIPKGSLNEKEIKIIKEWMEGVDRKWN